MTAAAYRVDFCLGLSTPSLGITEAQRAGFPGRRVGNLSTPSFGITFEVATPILTAIGINFQLPLSGSRHMCTAVEYGLRTEPFNSLFRDHDVRSFFIHVDYEGNAFNSLFRDHAWWASRANQMIY